MQKVSKLISRISFFLHSKDSLAIAEAMNYKDIPNMSFLEDLKCCLVSLLWWFHLLGFIESNSLMYMFWSCRVHSPSKPADEAEYQNLSFANLNASSWQQKSAFTRTVSPGSVSPIHGQVCSWYRMELLAQGWEYQYAKDTKAHRFCTFGILYFWFCH